MITWYYIVSYFTCKLQAAGFIFILFSNFYATLMLQELAPKNRCTREDLAIRERIIKHHIPLVSNGHNHSSTIYAFVSVVELCVLRVMRRVRIGTWLDCVTSAVIRDLSGCLNITNGLTIRNPFRLLHSRHDCVELIRIV